MNKIAMVSAGMVSSIRTYQSTGAMADTSWRTKYSYDHKGSTTASVANGSSIVLLLIMCYDGNWL
jgi:hypothetical protein